MPRRTKELNVTVTFESNRLEEQNINMAYEFVFPIKHGLVQRTVRMQLSTGLSALWGQLHMDIASFLRKIRRMGRRIMK